MVAVGDVMVMVSGGGRDIDGRGGGSSVAAVGVAAVAAVVGVAVVALSFCRWWRSIIITSKMAAKPCSYQVRYWVFAENLL